MIIAPSLLSANFADLKTDLQMLSSSQAEWLHYDVMDGNFVPNISFGLPILASIRKTFTKTIDVHLMIEKNDDFIEAFAKAGADNITVHYEVCTHLHRTIELIKSFGKFAGVALNPHTPVHLLEDIVGRVDMVLIMSVNPGFGGQKFIENTLKKVAQTKELILQKNSKALIEVDGGVNATNAISLKKAGADVLVAGNFVFSAPNPIATIEDLKKI